MKNTEVKTYNRIVELGIATTAEINLVRMILSDGWDKVFESIIFARTGYRTLAQYEKAKKKMEEK